MNAKHIINGLKEYGFSTEAATILQNRFPSHNSSEIHYLANEGSKEELMKLCEHDTALFDKEKDEFTPVTWDYIEKKYGVIELSNGEFVLISSWQQ